jgi:hypothetical protein
MTDSLFRLLRHLFQQLQRHFIRLDAFGLGLDVEDDAVPQPGQVGAAGGIEIEQKSLSQFRAKAAFKHDSSSPIMACGRLPITCRMSACATVKRLLHFTTDGPCKPVALPSGVAGSMNNCVGSPACSTLPEIMATIVFESRWLSRSFCTTKAGRFFQRRPSTYGNSTITISPRFVGSFPVEDRERRPRP